MPVSSKRIGSRNQRDAIVSTSTPPASSAPQPEDFIVLVRGTRVAAARQLMLGSTAVATWTMTPHELQTQPVREVSKSGDHVRWMWRNVPLNRAGAFIVCCAQGRESQIIARVRHVCSHDAPVVLLSDPNSSQSIAGLMCGADFVFPAPIESATLHAARLAFRRAHGQETYDAEPTPPAIETGSIPASRDPLGMIEAGPLKVDRQMRRLWIRGEEVPISERPFELLRYMIERLGQVCPRSEIIQRVWDIDFDPGTNVIDVQVYKLRGILEEHGLRDMLQTVRGRGYRLVWPLPTKTDE